LCKGGRLNVKRNGLLILLIIALIGASVPSVVMAAESDEPDIYESYAERLKTMGLLQGTDGGFELDRVPTRLESVIMLIRLLGQEEAAAAQQPGMHPFRDVPAWGDKYVSYAYRNQLAAGIAADRFGSADGVTAEQYFTFVLRALGYSDAQGDFTWNQSVEAAVEAGIQTHTDYRSAAGPFLRANLVDISFHALQAKLKDQGMTLLEKLKRGGAADKGEDADAGTDKGEKDGTAEDRSVAVPVKLAPSSDSSAWSRYAIDPSTIKQYFPEAYSISLHTGNMQVGDVVLSGEDPLRAAVLYALSNDGRLLLSGMGQSDGIFLSGNPALLNSAAVWDRNGRMLSIVKPGSLVAEELEVKFVSGDDDAVRQVRTEWEQVAASVQDARYFPNDRFHVETYTSTESGTDGSQSEREVKALFVDRTALPTEAQAFTKALSMLYFGEQGRKVVSEADGIRNQLKELATRSTIYEMWNLAMAKPYHADRGLTMLFQEIAPTVLDLPGQSVSLSRQPTLSIVMLQDDEGRTLAYTYFTESDIKRLKSQ